MHFPFLSSAINKPDGDSPKDSGWATFIGIIICLCGNIIISFALNIQRLAHERIQSEIIVAIEEEDEQQQQPEEERGRHIPTAILEPTTLVTIKNVNEIDEDDEFEGTRYLKSSLWWT